MFYILIVLSLNFYLTHQHAYLIDPPSRTSAWMVDEEFKQCCKNYNYNAVRITKKCKLINLSNTEAIYYVASVMILKQNFHF
jgi:hypothetical protein